MSGRLLTKPLLGSNAKNHANAATTVTIPYGISTAVRTSPRPNSARCMTSARTMPSTSSMATEMTVTSVVLKTSCHHSGEVSTAL